MKRFLLTAALVIAALLIPASCEPLEDVEVDATLYCIFANGDGVVLGPATYGPYYSTPLSTSRLMNIFDDLTMNIRVENLSSAHMHIVYYDRVTQDYLGEEAYQFTGTSSGWVVAKTDLYPSY